MLAEAYMLMLATYRGLLFAGARVERLSEECEDVRCQTLETPVSYGSIYPRESVEQEKQGKDGQHAGCDVR